MRVSIDGSVSLSVGGPFIMVRAPGSCLSTGSGGSQIDFGSASGKLWKSLVTPMSVVPFLHLQSDSSSEVSVTFLLNLVVSGSGS